MKKIRIALVLALIALFSVSAWAEEPLSIVCTNFPCYDFAVHAAGDRASVTLLIKPGVEVHSFEPAPSDIIEIGQADMFVYIGGEGDAWVENILAGFDGEGPETLRMMDCVVPLEEEGEEEHEAPEYDEHIWTSPKNAMVMVEALGARLGGIDPDRAGAYAAAAADYAGQIEEIDRSIADLVEGAARRELVFADRFPFLYFIREFGLDYIAAFPSCTTDTEPTPQTLLSLIQCVERDHIPAIYTIEMSTQAVARSVAEETGAAILTLHSAQTVTQQEFERGESYVTLMEKNIEALREGLS